MHTLGLGLENSAAYILRLLSAVIPTIELTLRSGKVVEESRQGRQGRQGRTGRKGRKG